MSYSVYFKVNGKKYKLPVNPESIELSRNLNTQTFTVVGGTEVLMPTSTGLYKVKFSFELPSFSYTYLNNGIRKKADYYEKMLKNAQNFKKPIFFIASNEITEDISLRVLITSLTIREEAGEEGDKKIDIELTEYKEARRLYKLVEVKKEENIKNNSNEESKKREIISNKKVTKAKPKKSIKTSKQKDVRYKTGGEINNVNAIISGHVMEAKKKFKPKFYDNLLGRITLDLLINPKKKRISRRGLSLWKK